ncbi:MAG: CvpA family protein [Candidatus Scalinduaceae bacterium]
MHWLDYALIVFMAIGALLGTWTGPLWQVYRICSVILSVIAALLIYKILSSILDGLFNPEMANIVSFGIVFVIILIMTYAIGNLFKSTLTKRKFGISGRILGGGFAFIKAILTCSIIISGVSFMEGNRAGVIVSNSLIAHNLDKGAKVVISMIPQNLKDKLPSEKTVNVKK